VRYAASPLKPWFDSLRSGKGPCCSDADGYALSDVDWESRAGGYRVRIPRWRFEPSAAAPAPPAGTEMVWIDVEDDAVITEPNRAGRTMVWPIWGHQGPSIRCFMPGSMNSAPRGLVCPGDRAIGPGRLRGRQQDPRQVQAAPDRC
jgi:hypothetical protein